MTSNHCYQWQQQQLQSGINLTPKSIELLNDNAKRNNRITLTIKKKTKPWRPVTQNVTLIWSAKRTNELNF